MISKRQVSKSGDIYIYADCRGIHVIHEHAEKRTWTSVEKSDRSLLTCMVLYVQPGYYEEEDRPSILIHACDLVELTKTPKP